MPVTDSEIGAYVDSLSDVGTPASGDELLIYDVSATTTKKVLASALAGTGMTNPMTTQDDIIVAGASGTPGRLGKGSDGQVLTVDPTTHHLVWATPSAGGSAGALVLLGEYVASASATLDCITRNAAGQSGNLFQSTDYDDYLVKLVEVLPANGTVSLQLRVHTAGGYQAGTGYKVSGFAYAAGGSALYGTSGLSSGGFSNAADLSNTAGEGIVGTLEFFSPVSALSYKKIDTRTRSVVTNLPKSTDGHIVWNDTTSVDGFQLFMSSGNIASGKVRVYGIAK